MDSYNFRYADEVVILPNVTAAAVITIAYYYSVCIAMVGELKIITFIVLILDYSL